MILRYVAAAWLAGTTLGALGWGAWWPALVLGGTGVALGWLIAGRHRKALLVGIVIAAGIAGLLRYEASLPSAEPQGVATLNDGEAVRLLGTIATEPEERVTSQRFVVHVAYVEVDGTWRETSGRVQVTARQFPRHRYGEVVDMTAALETPPVFDTFDYREYLARRGIASTALFPRTEVLGRTGDPLKRRLLDARRPFGEALALTLPEPESALARGILLGQRASIPADVMETFNVAGISHLIAISGFHAMLVAGAVLAALTPLVGRRRATLAAMAAVVLYAAFTGGSPSVLRAALMAQVTLGATLVGRPGAALSGVALAGALLVLWRPLIIDDVAFQLSLASTLGIVTMAGPMRERALGWLSPRLPAGPASFLAEQTAITTAASLAALPILASTFGRFSLVALPANVLATPAFIFAFLGAALTAVVGAIDTAAGRAVGEVAYLPLHFLVSLAQLMAGLPLAALTLEGFGLVHALAFYALIGAVALALARLPAEPPEAAARVHLKPAPMLALASVLAAAMLWWSALQPGDANLRVFVLDVGQGDAILVQSPGGTRLLVDGGPSGAVLMRGLGEALPPGDRRIDLLVLTHPHDDHVAGLVEVLRRYEVGGVLWNGQHGETAAFREWREAVDALGLPVAVARAGQVLDMGDGAYFEVVHPQPALMQGSRDDLNNNSVVLRLVYGEIAFLLTGDIESEAEEVILEAGHEVSATVLKVAHHGSGGASTQPFLDAVSPSVAVLSAGDANPFGHPAPGVRLRLAGVPLLRTDANGTVRFETDGTQLWLHHERGDVEVMDPAFVP